MGSWLPYFLAYYPGIFSYDVTYQLFQRIGFYTTDHPLFHTLMIQGAVWIGNHIFHDINAGVAVYTIFQMLVTAASGAYLMLFLKRSGLRRVIRIILLAFISFFPVWSLLTISATKDVLFADAFMVSAICIAYWCFNSAFTANRKILVLFSLSMFIGCLLRSSAYIFITVTIIGSIFFIRKKQAVLRILICSVITAALAAGMGVIMQAATQATPYKPNESIGVPLQQMAYSSVFFSAWHFISGFHCWLWFLQLLTGSTVSYCSLFLFISQAHYSALLCL